MPITGLLKKNRSEAPKVIPRKSDPPVHHGDPHGDESNWLVSYADMMTLLCGFFVMLFSFAKMDDTKYEKAKEEIAKQFKGTYISPNAEVQGFVTQALLTAGAQKNVVVKSDPTGVSIIFESVMFFDTLSADVKADGAVVLNKLIQTVKHQQEKSGKQYRIVVEGHTDSRPIVGGSFASNWELSSSRASGVVRMFLNQGFTPDRLIAIGYADTRPRMPPRKADGSFDEEALGKNRRVVLRIMEPGMEMIPLPEIEKAQVLTAAAAESIAAPPQAAAPAPAATPVAAPIAAAPAPAPASAPPIPGVEPAREPAQVVGPQQPNAESKPAAQ